MSSIQRQGGPCRCGQKCITAFVNSSCRRVRERSASNTFMNVGNSARWAATSRSIAVCYLSSLSANSFLALPLTVRPSARLPGGPACVTAIWISRRSSSTTKKKSTTAPMLRVTILWLLRLRSKDERQHGNRRERCWPRHPRGRFPGSRTAAKSLENRVRHLISLRGILAKKLLNDGVQLRMHQRRGVNRGRSS